MFPVENEWNPIGEPKPIRKRCLEARLPCQCDQNSTLGVNSKWDPAGLTGLGSALWLCLLWNGLAYEVVPARCYASVRPRGICTAAEKLMKKDWSRFSEVPRKKPLYIQVIQIILLWVFEFQKTKWTDWEEALELKQQDAQFMVLLKKKRRQQWLYEGWRLLHNPVATVDVMSTAVVLQGKDLKDNTAQTFIRHPFLVWGAIWEKWWRYLFTCWRGARSKSELSGGGNWPPRIHTMRKCRQRQAVVILNVKIRRH